MDAAEEFDRLVGIMQRLRAECPWDRSQSHGTLRAYLLEEAYEVLHALDEECYDDLCDELGDLMLQIIFHAEIAEEAGRFDIEEVLRRINEKLVRRHPHVFGEKVAETPADVVRRWESIKRDEEQKASALDGVPPELPALVKAMRILTKVRQTGIDPFWGTDPLTEGRRWLEGLASAAADGERARTARAAGMLTLVVAELASRARVSAEDALRRALQRLTDAFRREEERLREDGCRLDELSEDQRKQIAARILAECEGD
ncbi:MAG: nucleoside triphosphate pyrophosphohydrolase [Planctomycetota bacterium]|jgi:MazG family protein